MSTDSETIVTTKPKTRETQQTRQIPPYNVILENDDHHSFEFVIGVLQKALGYKLERAVELTMQAHQSGRSIVWTGPKEVAELKCEQVRTFHEIREPGGKNLGPLAWKCTAILPDTSPAEVRPPCPSNPWPSACAAGRCKSRASPS